MYIKKGIMRLPLVFVIPLVLMRVTNLIYRGLFHLIPANEFSPQYIFLSNLDFRMSV